MIEVWFANLRYGWPKVGTRDACTSDNCVLAQMLSHKVSNFVHTCHAYDIWPGPALKMAVTQFDAHRAQASDLLFLKSFAKSLGHDVKVVKRD